MRIYLASRYSRRLELCAYREILREHGHVVEARWLNGGHQISDHGTPIGNHGEKLVEGDDGSTDVRAAALRSQFASDDYDDVFACKCLIAFTEPPRSEASRGGRHVELGLAIAWHKRVMIVGPRENLFCWLPSVEQFASFDEIVACLRSETTA